ncbi:MAG: SPOR domain-containing protein [Dechloromonas sp.]|nr:SPOR domain-containing protein [Dechloromonas sp.]
MAEQANGQDNDNAAGELRGQLTKRLAVAGVLVAMLLGILAFFDYLANPPQDSEAVVFTRPVPVAPQKAVSQPVTPAENLPEPPAPEKTEAATEAPPPPTVEAQPAVPVETKPEVRPDQRSSPPVAGHRLAPAHPPVAAAPVPSKPIAEGTAEPSLQSRPLPSAEPVPSKPVARQAEPRAAAPVLPPAVSRLFSGFVLQAGVFSSSQRAEELHARLTLSGVPSTLETRVQVGPFRTKQEAEAAQAKLKELGIETILIPPRGKNP